MELNERGARGRKARRLDRTFGYKKRKNLKG
jgi:hypothetical protein